MPILVYPTYRVSGLPADGVHAILIADLQIELPVPPTVVTIGAFAYAKDTKNLLTFDGLIWNVIAGGGGGGSTDDEFLAFYGL